MPQNIASVALLVRDYDEAIAFFTGALGFELVDDSPRTPGKRWVVVSPASTRGAPASCSLLLARAATPIPAGADFYWTTR